MIGNGNGRRNPDTPLDQLLTPVDSLQMRNENTSSGYVSQEGIIPGTECSIPGQTEDAYMDNISDQDILTMASTMSKMSPEELSDYMKNAFKEVNFNIDVDDEVGIEEGGKQKKRKAYPYYNAKRPKMLAETDNGDTSAGPSTSQILPRCDRDALTVASTMTNLSLEELSDSEVQNDGYKREIKEENVEDSTIQMDFCKREIMEEEEEETWLECAEECPSDHYTDLGSCPPTDFVSAAPGHRIIRALHLLTSGWVVSDEGKYSVVKQAPTGHSPNSSASKGSALLSALIGSLLGALIGALLGALLGAP